MARGGYGQGSGIPLGERRRVDLPEPVGDDCPARHVWVSGAADHLGKRRPGLLVEWRKRGAMWEGRVAYVATLRGTAWATVEEWLPADQIEPV